MKNSIQQQLQEEQNKISQIKQLLEGVDPLYLMSAIRQMGQVYVPQCYYNEHAQEMGFENVLDMREQLEDFNIYYHVDQIIGVAVEELEK